MVLLHINKKGYGHDPTSGHTTPQCCEAARTSEREDMAAPVGEREARKRRERRESGSSERKERRSQSEERAPPPPPPPLHDCNSLESERRAERLSRARRPQNAKRRRPPCLKKHQDDPAKENDCLIIKDEVTLSPLQPEMSPSQKHFYEYLSQSEGLDLAALHRQLDREEPIKSYAAQRARPEDHNNEPRRPLRDAFNPDRRLDKINKKITVLKKSITKYETEYENAHGYVITASERITDVHLTRMYETLRKLQTEKKCIKADPVEYALKVQQAKQQKERDDRLDAALKSDKSMADVVLDIEVWLEGCRQAAGRVLPESNWSSAQLAAEKLCVQRALLRLEAARGRPPAHSADRGAARHLYEKYRNVKRALGSMKTDATLGVNGELATIHEHELMLFNTSVDSSSDSPDKHSDTDQEDTSDTGPQSPTGQKDTEEPSNTSSARSLTASDEAPTNEGLHCLSLDELKKALNEAKLYKCTLRRSLKEYDVTFETQNSIKLQREDKVGKEEDYLKYKTVKARIKLLNALINKQQVPP